MTCFECDPAFGGNLWHCHEVSIEHADGTTECLAGGCELPHEGHHWQLPCAEIEPRCGCLPVEIDPGGRPEGGRLELPFDRALAA